MSEKLTHQATDTDDTDSGRPGWAAWYAAARAEMAFRYGRRRIPKDAYKEQYSLGATPQQAAKAIDKDARFATKVTEAR